MKTIRLLFVLLNFNGFYQLEARTQETDSLRLTNIVHYSFSINISDNSDSIYCEENIHLKALSDFIKFTLNLENKKENGKGMHVISVLKNGEKIKFLQNNDYLEIIETKVIHARDTVSYVIKYGGVPSDGLIISKNKFGKRTFFGDNWPERARYWLACNDYPGDKATVSFSVTAPAHYQVIANGKLLSKIKQRNGNTQWNWNESIPISTKVMVFGAADFSISSDSCCGGIPVETWVYSENRSQGFLDYAPAKAIVDTFTRIIGPFPYEKLANVQSTTIYGGMENASCIFYSENSVNGKGKAESLLAHEIAHQWFGNSVTESNWSNLWLSEGFATFFANVYFERKYGKDSLHYRLRKERDEAIQWPGTLTMAVIPQGKVMPRSQLTPVTYEKAGWILNMLRSKIGDDDFFKGIAEYYKGYKNVNASTDDFRKVMETVSGKNLEDFFRQWLLRPGYPDLQIQWHFNTEQKILQLSVEQLQTDLYRLDLSVSTGDPQNLLQLKISERSSRYSFKLKTVPVQIKIDPETKVFARFNLDKQ